MEISYRRGLYLRGLDLWLDPHEKQTVAVVSHAHADHARAHTRTICTPATALLLAERRLAGKSTDTVNFGQARPLVGGQLTLLPAGHVLGSAQVLVEQEGGRLLYSGDFKLRQSLTAEQAVVPNADTLVMETTFGRPKYRFPSAEETIGRIEQFCRQALANGETAVLYVYSLGKAQELLAALGVTGLTLRIHPSIHAICEVYRHCGILLPPYQIWRPGEHQTEPEPCVLLVPPQAGRAGALTSLGRLRTAYISGWAIDRGAVYRFRCDAAFPLSDHADYDELCEYVRRVGPARIFTVHGFAREFARDLRGWGYYAYPLGQPEQLQLF
ncbi:MAG: MBL fold metallo-hydrolase RNA specificity domain-containing protein [Dehalococcoidia bacterium]